MSYSDTKAVAKDLYRAAVNGSPKWRLGVTAVLVCLCVGAVWGWHNFALAEDVDNKIATAVKPITDDIEAIKEQQKKDLISDLTDKLLSAKRDQCEATREGRSARGWTKRITELMDEYFLLSTKPFDMPDCREV